MLHFGDAGIKRFALLLVGLVMSFWTGQILPARTLGENEASPMT